MHDRRLSVDGIRRRISIDLSRVPSGLPPVRSDPLIDRRVRLVHAVVRPAAGGYGSFARWCFGRDAKVAQYRRARLLPAVVEEDIVAVSPQPRGAGPLYAEYLVGCS